MTEREREKEKLLKYKIYLESEKIRLAKKEIKKAKAELEQLGHDHEKGYSKRRTR